LGLSNTFESLLEQVFQDWELYIVTGPSTDSTLELAKQLALRDSRVKVIAESGHGIYPAMNEGLNNSSGELCWFMNAGDRFDNINVLQRATLEFSNQTFGLVIGGHRVVSKNDSRIYSHSTRGVSEIEFAFNRRGGCHQAIMFRTQILKDIGGFDTQYSLASDFDLVLRAIRISGASRVSEIFALIEPGGVADQSIFSVLVQKHLIRRKHFTSRAITFLSLTWTTLACSKHLVRRFFCLLKLPLP
jgi:cellulose synthase/poly-beta-1,6-N-acetylglucosamine synthase-like glycosyltransferase